MRFKLISCGNVVGYADTRDSAEMEAAAYSRSVTEFGVDIYGTILGEYAWMARFYDGQCAEKMRGYGPVLQQA